MNKLMVIDGNSIVNRAFYGVSQNLTTRDGQPTNAVLGFLNILNKLLDEVQPQGLCVTFDRKAPPSAIWPTRATRPTARACPRSWPARCPF